MNEESARERESRKEREQIARQMARLWKVAKAAIRLIDTAQLRGRGLYEIEPSVMLALRHGCADCREAITRAEKQVAADIAASASETEDE